MGPPSLPGLPGDQAGQRLCESFRRATQITAPDCLQTARWLLQPSLWTLSQPDTMALFSLITKPMCCVDSFIIFNEIICVAFDLIFSPVSNRVVE